MYSYVEFNLRRLCEALDRASLLLTKYKGKSTKLDIGDVEKAVREAPAWSDLTAHAALARLAELRPSRNLIAHFIVRRFPKDDAFLFMTKSDKDYKRYYGAEPSPMVAMTAVIERKELVKVLKEVQEIHKWLAVVAQESEVHLLSQVAPKA